MQSISPVTTTQLLARTQTVLYKFEIYYGSDWTTIADLKSVSVTPSGAGPTPEVIAGTWSAEIYNDDNKYHPLNASSSFKDYFQIGRKVRISIGGTYGGVAYYWQRIIGYMDAPKFDLGARVVSLSGCDYSKRLADFNLRDGTNYWGTSQTYSTIASIVVLGSEIYDEADALEIGAHEAGNLTNWVDVEGSFTAILSGGGGSTYVGRLMSDDIYTDSSAYNDDVGSFTAGTTYTVSFKYIRVNTHALGNVLSCFVYKSGTGYSPWGSIAGLNSTTWATASFQFTCPETTTARLTFKATEPVKAGTAYVYVDEVSIKPHTSDMINATYELPAASNGPYYVTLDEGGGATPIFFGSTVNEWTYSESTRALEFAVKKVIQTGTDNLVVYYYTTETVEHAVARILKDVGFYASEALALADMDYVPTSTDIPRLWFETDTTAIEAIRQLCERVNYRFWFDYSGKPSFKPAPALDEADFTFTAYGNLGALSIEQDIGQVRNRVVIEGIERGMYSVNEDKKKSRYTGTSSDSTSIASYLEHTETITNHLFQDQDSIDTAAAAILAERKEPRWYADIAVPHFVAPLEVGDIIAFYARFTTGGTDYLYKAVVRGLEISEGGMMLRCEYNGAAYAAPLTGTLTLPAPAVSIT